MPTYSLKNKAEVDRWLWDHRDNGCRGVKGPPPPDMVYDEDNEPVTRPINVAWEDVKTGERIEMIYVRDEELNS